MFFDDHGPPHFHARHNEVFENASLGILVFFGTEGTLVRENHVARNGDNIILDANANTVAHNLVTDARGCPFCDPRPGSASWSTPATTTS
jgi:hypothetical protein